MNMKEIKDIAMWEETDSELAKYNIQKLSSENYYYKSYMENIEQVNKYLYKRIDKAIETLEKRIEENEEIDYVDGLEHRINKAIEYIKKNDMSYYGAVVETKMEIILNILKGSEE